MSVAAFDDAERVPVAGEVVSAVQPDDDGPDYVGTARVIELDDARQLIVLDVDWDSFADDLMPADSLRQQLGTSRTHTRVTWEPLFDTHAVDVAAVGSMRPHTVLSRLNRPRLTPA